ncbi:Uncharacterized protein FKW44_005214, partial [Caligus rogercresseyi]
SSSSSDPGKNHHSSSVSCPLMMKEPLVIPPTPTHELTQSLIGYPEEVSTQV